MSARPKFIPDDQIPAGDETDRLHRWGYVELWLQRFGGWTEVSKNLNGSKPKKKEEKLLMVREKATTYGEKYADVSFLSEYNKKG
jgi:hypothetical protein